MGFLKKIGKAVEKGVKKITKNVRKLAPYAGTAIGAYFGGPMGAAAGGTIGSLVRGKSGNALGMAASGLAGLGLDSYLTGSGTAQTGSDDTGESAPWYSRLWNSIKTGASNLLSGNWSGTNADSNFLGGLLNTGLGTIGSYLTSQEQLKQQERLQDKAFNQSVEMWNMQNAYNTPAAQMERYRAAGLNPNLIYGNGVSSAGNASGAPQYDAPHYKGMDMQSIMAFQSMQNLEMQNELLNQQLALAKQQTRGATADADVKVINAGFAKDLNEAELGQKKATTRKVEADADSTEHGDNNSMWTYGFWRKAMVDLLNKFDKEHPLILPY